MRKFLKEPTVIPAVLDNSCVVLRQESPLDEFVIDKLYSGDVVTDVISTDVDFFLNQQRITNDLIPALNQILSNVRQSSISDHLSQFSDEMLLKVIKPRYLQASSELVDWSKYLMDSLDREQQRMLAQQEQEQQQEQTQSQQSSESSTE